MGASGGTSFGDEPGYNRFSLGGLLRLGAFDADQLRGDNYVHSQAGALIRVLRLPDFFAGNGDLVGWLEVGPTFDGGEDLELEWQATTGFVVETFLGPAFVDGSISLQSGEGRFYISLAPVLR